ncbi:spore photoproduct lyase family protein [Neolewinella litorea]|uniref:Uncharacterized protein n=1 Tax=Neolewinella litorea TaxID=2562452 RepID=A0A4S4NQM3_9BACT|nr:hypothetical protein [Neolewinella litorea]THH40661.1 hypothetical protein E4021_07995 [Neolewinella litorea]
MGAAVTSATPRPAHSPPNPPNSPGSKEILLDWYPNTSLDFNEETRAKKRNKFGSHKFVYTREQMDELKGWFSAEIKARFPEGEVLYFTLSSGRRKHPTKAR